MIAWRILKSLLIGAKDIKSYLKSYLSYILFRWGGLTAKKHFDIDYQPDPGRSTEKAERLVKFCLGDLSHRPIVPCTRDPRYRNKKNILSLRVVEGKIELSGGLAHGIRDQKKVVQALTSQRAAIPPGLFCWLVSGDGAGIGTEPKQGLHIAGMRRAQYRHVVLMPTANRERYLGPNLQKQIEDIRRSWVPWQQKSDTAWWGGALTGDHWRDRGPRTLTRREVLCYFQDHPNERIHLHLTEIPSIAETLAGVELKDDFKKGDAFKHKCLILLPGNDIASGSSWYFAGNSVILMPRPHLEHILYFEMEPWVHYVPLENDPADIPVKLEWVLNNQEEAQKIVSNSHERLHWFCGPEYLWACNQVLRRITQ